MSTSNVHPRPTLTTTTRLPSAPETGHGGQHHTIRNAVLALGGAAVVLAGMAGIRYAQTQQEVASTASTGTVAVAQAPAVPNAALRALKSELAAQPAAATAVVVPNAALRALKSELAAQPAAATAVVVPNAALRALKSELAAPPPVRTFVVPNAAMRALKAELS